MSADNWDECPRCRRIRKDWEEECQLEVSRAYGVVSSEAYLEMVKALETKPIIEYNLREDYEVSIDKENTFWIRYKAHCQKCGWSFNFEYDEVIET